MFVAKEQETLFEAQSGPLYAPPTAAFATTESHETTHNLSFRPKGVDWACSSRKNKKHFQKHKVVHRVHPSSRFHNGYLSATESRETT